MNLLELIWLISLILAGLSILVMFGLIVRRVISMRRDRLESAARDALTTLILDYLEGTVTLDALRGAARGKNSRLMSDIVRDLLRLIRGDDRDRLIALLRELGVVELHLSALHRRNPHARMAAIAALSFFDEPRVINEVRARLDDPDAAVRLAAAQALGELRSVGSVRVLVDKLQIGTRETSRELYNVFRKLAPEETSQLISLLHVEVPDLVKALALDALGKSGDYSAIDAVAGMVTDESENVRAQALRALAELAHPAAQPMVMRALTDPSWAVRAVAARCAGRIGLSEAIPLLEDLLDDDVWWVRQRAAESLYELGDLGIKALTTISRKASRASRVAQIVLAEKAIAA